MKNHITYLLGAGASYKNLPIQSELIEHIGSLRATAYHSKIGPVKYAQEKGQLYNDLKYRLIVNEEFQPSLPFRDELLSKLNRHLYRIEAFDTIDIYAKYLFLRNQNDQLVELKAIIDYYFQLRYWWNDIDSSWARKVDDKFVRMDDEDSRYDALMAALLLKQSNGSPTLPTNVSFLSWNYDLNLELSYSKFFRDLDSDAKAHFRKVPDLVHLNGHASYFEKGDPFEIMDGINSGVKYFGKDIKYAFEQDVSEIKSNVKFQNILNKTTHLVVIGYSFPVFNRSVDRMILRAPYLQKIFIQDSIYERSISIKDRIIQMRRHNSDRYGNEAVKPENIIALKDSNQFFVPNELDDEGENQAFLA